MSRTDHTLIPVMNKMARKLREVRESYEGSVCPHCFKRDFNASTYFKGTYNSFFIIVDCPNCGKEYWLKQELTVKYISREP